MKDFNEWLNDLTGELQEPDEAPKINIIGEDAENYYVEVYQGSGDLWAEDLARKLYGQQAEEVCECEEAEYARHHPENTELWTAAAREFCKQVASSYGLTTDIMAGELGKNMTATEVNMRQVEAELRMRRGKSILMEEAIKRLDEYRRGTWREEDENE